MQTLLSRLFVETQSLENGEDVLLDRQPAENRWLLRQVTDAFSCARIHRGVGEVFLVKQNAPGIRRRESHRHVEGRGFPRAVRPQ